MARGFNTNFGVGAGDRVSPASYTSPVKFSSAFWYKIGGTALSRFFDKGDIFLLWDNVAPQLQRTWSGGTGIWAATDGVSATSGTWVHLVISYDGSSAANDPVFYVNGNVASFGKTGTPSGTINQNSAPNVIGNRASGDRTFTGVIGDVAFWSGAALTQAEAQAIYRGADPRDIQRRFLEDYISMESGPPASLAKATQPVTVGTKSGADRLPPFELNNYRFLGNVTAATGAISGSSTVAFSTSATLTGTGALSGAASFAFTTTGSMGAPGLMSGTSTVAFSTTATLRGTGRLLGVSSPAFTTSATLTASGKLSGASTVAFTTSGTLTQPGAISGTASIAFSTAGTLRGAGALSGSTTLTFTATAIPSGGAIWAPVAPSSATWTLTAPDDSIWTPIN